MESPIALFLGLSQANFNIFAKENMCVASLSVYCSAWVPSGHACILVVPSSNTKESVVLSVPYVSLALASHYPYFEMLVDVQESWVKQLLASGAIWVDAKMANDYLEW